MIQDRIMSQDFVDKWNDILAGVDKNKIPIHFIKKMVVKLEGKKQQTINLERLLAQGLEISQVEEAVSRKIREIEDQIVSIEFVLDIKAISETIQPETDQLLKDL